MLDAALYSILSGNAAVAAVVSTRIYRSVLAQGVTKPAIVIRIPSTRQVESLQGSSGVAYSNVEFGAYAATEEAAQSLGELIRLALENYKGTAASVVVQGVVDWSCGEAIQDAVDLFEHLSWCTIWHEVTKPV